MLRELCPRVLRLRSLCVFVCGFFLSSISFTMVLVAIGAKISRSFFACLSVFLDGLKKLFLTSASYITFDPDRRATTDICFLLNISSQYAWKGGKSSRYSLKMSIINYSFRISLGFLEMAFIFSLSMSITRAIDGGPQFLYSFSLCVFPASQKNGIHTDIWMIDNRRAKAIISTDPRTTNKFLWRRRALSFFPVFFSIQSKNSR